MGAGIAKVPASAPRTGVEKCRGVGSGEAIVRPAPRVDDATMQRTGPNLDARASRHREPGHPVRLLRTTRPVGYLVRFEGGPWDRWVRLVPMRASGGPWDFQSVDRHGDGIYVLAGAEDAEGRLPYWWMTWDRAALLQAGPADLAG